MRVVVAEDNLILREGVSRLLSLNGIDVAALVGDAAGLLREAADPDVDLAIVDVRMPPTQTTEGLEAAIELRRRRARFPVLVLSQHVEVLYARELFVGGEGGVGYLLKDRVVDPRAFVEAVHQVAAGGTVLDPTVVAALLGRAAHRTGVDRLTPREREVLALMAEGRSNTAIADALVVTEKAVGKHSSNIFTKLDLPPAADDNRRVLAVLAWLEATGSG